MINAKTNTPNYTKIQNYVIEKINSGEYPIGSKIPSENDLAEQFNVSRITANKAIKELSVMGILERCRGKGSFVCSKEKLVTDSKAFMSAINMDILSKRTHSLLQFQVIQIPESLSDKTWINNDTGFYSIIMANMKGSEKESLDFTYLPCSLTDNVPALLEGLNKNYVFDYLKKLDGISPKYMKIFLTCPDDYMVSKTREVLCTDANIHAWSTCIYDSTMKLLSITYSVSPITSQDTPLFTFSI